MNSSILSTIQLSNSFGFLLTWPWPWPWIGLCPWPLVAGGGGLGGPFPGDACCDGGRAGELVGEATWQVFLALEASFLKAWKSFWTQAFREPWLSTYLYHCFLSPPVTHTLNYSLHFLKLFFLIFFFINKLISDWLLPKNPHKLW